MKTYKYNFVFDIGKKVKVIELNIKGKINGIFITNNEISYKVRFIYNNDIKEWYFTADELENVENETIGVGFKQDVKK